MLAEDRYFQTLSEEELWQRYCGFLDLSITEFMNIQKVLLADEIERVAESTLGKKIMGTNKPKNLEEFRSIVPLTNYDAYEPYLSERREEVLAIKPHLWCHSSGRGGSFKWVPHSSEFLEKMTKLCIGSLILATSQQKGTVNIAPGFRILLTLPPAPYTSGAQFETVAESLTFRVIPDPKESKDLDFQRKIQKGFQVALKDGVDVIGSIASLMVKMGEVFSEQAQNIKFSPAMLDPRILSRYMRAWIRSKREKRGILPKDLWPAKAIMAGGVDSGIYKNDIAHYWGQEPYNPYGLTEAFLIAVPTWTKKAMVFPPDIVFLEFIPYNEVLKNQTDKNYQPSTVLLDQIEIGNLYEVVITHFYGMPLLRYRTKDLIKVVSLKDEETGVNLPHIVFQRRVDDVINLAALAQLDEKTIWQAIFNSKIKVVEWAACKEYSQNKSYLRLYLETNDGKSADQMANMIDDQLKIIDIDYRDIKSYLELQPVKVTILSPGTFGRYMEEKRKEGADLAWLKPPHINASEASIKRLLELSEPAR